MTGIDWAALQNAAKGQLDPIPDGEYAVKIIDAQATQTTNGKPMWKIKYQIEEGPHAPRKVWTNMTLSEESPMALAIFFRQMEAMGLDANFFAQGPRPEQVASALNSRLCRVTIGQDEWQGVKRNKVKSIAPSLGGGPVAPGVVAGPASPLPTAGATGLPTATPTAPPAAATTPTVPTDAPPPLPI